MALEKLTDLNQCIMGVLKRVSGFTHPPKKESVNVITSYNCINNTPKLNANPNSIPSHTFVWPRFCHASRVRLL